ncbi:hypothetical protein ABIE50_004039 [Chitinophaga sp. OAE865]
MTGGDLFEGRGKKSLARSQAMRYQNWNATETSGRLYIFEPLS